MKKSAAALMTLIMRQIQPRKEEVVEYELWEDNHELRITHKVVFGAYVNLN